MIQLGRSISFGYLSVLLLVVAALSPANGGQSDEFYEEADQFNIQHADVADVQHSKPTAKRAAVFLDKLIMAVRRGSLHNKTPLEAQKLHQPHPISSMNDDLPESKQSAASASSSNLQRNLLEVNSDGPNAKHLIAYPRMGLVRRGQKSGRVFWRCYFNAVSCFKK